MLKPKLIVFRGMPGTGKSTLIDKFKIKSNALSFDSIRELYSGLTINEFGCLTIDQRENHAVATMFFDILKHRLEERADIFIDNLNIKISDLSHFKKLAEENNYDFYILNFKLEKIDFYFERNKNREERKQLPVSDIERLYDYILNTDISKFSDHIITLSQFETLLNKTVLDFKRDLSSYKSVFHFSELNATKHINDIEIKKDCFYVFSGNYFCFGANYKETIDFLYSIKDNENVVLLCGHQEHLINKNIDNPDFSINFEIINDIYKLKIKEILNCLESFFIYSFNKKTVFVSFSGVNGIPERPYLLNRTAFVLNNSVNMPTLHNSDNETIQIFNNCLFFNSDSKNISLLNVFSKYGYVSCLKLNNNGVSLFCITPDFKLDKPCFLDFLKNKYFNDNNSSLEIKTSVFESIKTNKHKFFLIFQDSCLYHSFFESGKLVTVDEDFNNVDIKLDDDLISLIKDEFSVVSFLKIKNKNFIFDVFYKFNNNLKIKKYESNIFDVSNSKNVVVISSDLIGIDRIIKSKAKTQKTIYFIKNNKAIRVHK